MVSEERRKAKSSSGEAKPGRWPFWRRLRLSYEKTGPLGKVLCWITVVGLLGTMVGLIPYQCRDNRHVHIGALKPRDRSQHLSGPDFHGRVQMNQETGAVAVRMAEGAIVQPFGRYAPFSIRSEEEGILISAIIHSLDGRVVATIEDNNWVVNPNNYFRLNFDRSALEVMDQHDMPVLQVDYLDPGSVRIGGVLHFEEQETLELYPDFPSTPKSDNPRAVYSFRGVIMVMGKDGHTTVAQDTNPTSLRAAARKVGLARWFDYSDPKRLGVRRSD